MSGEEKVVIRVGGVPEHFNEPWQIAIEKNYFENENFLFQWKSIGEGTGAMINLLKSNELDLIVALTEGLINEIGSGESSIVLIGMYVQSSLCWSLSVSNESCFQSIEDLKGKRFGISRYQSGSHLMSCVLSHQYGWKENPIEFEVKNTFPNLISSLRRNEIDVFLWEYFMQKPFYDRKEIRQLGEICTPWPSFLLATRKEFLDRNLEKVQRILSILRLSCDEFRENVEESIERISSRYHLTKEDSRKWFDRVNIYPETSIPKSTISMTIDSLRNAKILSKKFNENSFDPNSFVDQRIAKVSLDIKSMRLYNKPELLIAFRNNLRFFRLSRGEISYRDLLSFDQNHYFGTEVLDLAVEKLQLNGKENSSKWFIQIGSNLGGCARYLAGQYHLHILAIELQTDLSQAAQELTERCQLNDRIHHIQGNFLHVSQHLQENIYYSICSWLTILHFNLEQRKSLFQQSFRLIEPGGFFYLEDFISIANLNEEEKNLLENDVFCQYLPNQIEYEQQIVSFGFQLISSEDLTQSWKDFTQQRFQKFDQNRSSLIEIHGEEIYFRLLSFYQSIYRLFQGNHLGGIRILAQKPF